MTAQTVFTLVNPQNGNLAFKISSFENANNFDHLQRLNYYTMILVLDGKAALKADFSNYEIEKNNLLCFTPYQPFMLSDTKELKGLILNFHPDFFCIHKHHKEVSCSGVLFNNIYNPPFVSLQENEVGVFTNLIEQMKMEMQNADLAQYELLISYLKIFLITASRIKIVQHPATKIEKDSSSEPFILQKLKDAIEEHYKTKHTASDYSDLLNISAPALGKICKTHFNKTLSDLISERIVIEAKRELYLTSKAVKQIAFGLGFTDEHYFSRFFKKNADISPQFYRDTVGFARAEA